MQRYCLMVHVQYEMAQLRVQQHSSAATKWNHLLINYNERISLTFKEIGLFALTMVMSLH